MKSILKKQPRITTLSKMILIKPENSIKFIWDLIMLLVLLILGLFIPYLLAFESEGSSLIWAIDLITMIIFSFDIIFTFNTAFYQEGNLIEDRIKIMKNYLKFWFWIDIISILPASLIYDQINLQNSNNILLSLRVLKLSKLIRLIRIAKLDQLVVRIEETLTSNFSVIALRCIKYCFLIFFVANLFACSMYATSSANDEPGNFINSILDKTENKDLEIPEMYLNCLYWALVTIVSIGYGDLSPKTTSERLIGIIIMFGSSGTFGVLIGLISSFIDKRMQKYQEMRARILALNKFFKVNKLNDSIKAKCRNYIDYASSTDHDSDAFVLDLLMTLPSSLKAEIMQYSDSIIVSKSKLFRFMDNEEIKAICQFLCVKIFYHQDLIIQEKEKPKAIYFLRKGFVQIIDLSSQSRICILKSGEHFGEIGFFTGESCVSSVISDGFSEALMLKIRSFELFSEKNPKIFEVLKKIRAETKNGDLTCIGIRCYLCMKIGHVAVKCSEIRRFEEVTRKWLKRRELSRYINPNLKLNKSAPRIRLSSYSNKYGGRNVVGKKRKVWQTFKTDSKLKSLVKFFYNEYKNWRGEHDDDEIFSLISYESWISNESEMKIKETINNILEESDEEVNQL